MAAPFSRSLRSLQIDSFRVSLIGMILASAVLLALIAWFFMARITLYENSANIQIGEDGRFLATFRPETMARLQVGQNAILRLNPGAEGGLISLPAMVIDRSLSSNQVELLILADISPQAFAGGGITAQVEVEVESVSPAALVIRASGQYLGERQLPVSPQSSQGGSP